MCDVKVLWVFGAKYVPRIRNAVYDRHFGSDDVALRAVETERARLAGMSTAETFY